MIYEAYSIELMKNQLSKVCHLNLLRDRWILNVWQFWAHGKVFQIYFQIYWLYSCSWYTQEIPTAPTQQNCYPALKALHISFSQETPSAPTKQIRYPALRCYTYPSHRHFVQHQRTKTVIHPIHFLAKPPSTKTNKN